jgi:hypothetical protein
MREGWHDPTYFAKISFTEMSRGDGFVTHDNNFRRSLSGSPLQYGHGMPRRRVLPPGRSRMSRLLAQFIRYEPQCYALNASGW